MFAFTVENLSKSSLVGHDVAKGERYTALRGVPACNARLPLSQAPQPKRLESKASALARAKAEALDSRQRQRGRRNPPPGRTPKPWSLLSEPCLIA